MTRKGKPMVQRPYVPESVKESSETLRQHGLAQRLGSKAIGHPALFEIIKAADEIAAELGKTPAQLTAEEADRAIALGEERHRAGR